MDFLALILQVNNGFFVTRKLFFKAAYQKVFTRNFIFLSPDRVCPQFLGPSDCKQTLQPRNQK